VTITVTGVLQQQAWRERVLPPVELVRPGLWSVPTPIPNHPLRYVLTYAMEYDGGIALVDTGWPSQLAMDGLESGLRHAGWAVEDVKAVLITHGHGDHMGLASRIRERSGAWVAMHEADAAESAGQGLDKPQLRENTETWLTRRGGDVAQIHGAMGAAPEDMFTEFGLMPDRFLQHGGRPLGPHTDLVSIWTPGHTPGHMCFYDAARNLMLTGDHVLPRITPNISPAPLVTDDVLGDYLESLADLADYDVEEVLPAHEYRFVGLAERIHDLRRHHEVRLGEVLTVLRDQPGTTSAGVAAGLHWSRVWDQMQGLQRRFAIGEAYAHLVHLEKSGYVANRGSDVDEWYALQDKGPVLIRSAARPAGDEVGVSLGQVQLDQALGRLETGRTAGRS
jgi:glyoxylase-like metal-dependent hydrolase (beta-lactamase superfamily II)